MNTRLFAFFILLMLFGIQGAFLTFQNELDGREVLEYEVANLKKQLEQEKVKAEVARYELESFQQVVAATLPKSIHQKDYSVRNIASIVVDGEPLAVKPSLDFATIKKMYLDSDYEKSAVQLRDFVKTYPESTHVLEAYYLQAMSYYKSKQFEKAIETIDILVKQYPSSEMTGLGLLVMGDIMKSKERYDEAKQIFLTVKNNFPYPELKKQAQAKLEEVML